jgi:hypothetical protein
MSPDGRRQHARSAKDEREQRETDTARANTRQHQAYTALQVRTYYEVRQQWRAKRTGAHDNYHWDLLLAQCHGQSCGDVTILPMHDPT